MRLVNQFRFIGSNLLGEVEDAIQDVRAGVVPEVRVEANRFLDLAESKVDDVLAQAKDAVAEVRQALRDGADTPS